MSSSAETALVETGSEPREIQAIEQDAAKYKHEKFAQAAILKLGKQKQIEHLS